MTYKTTPRCDEDIIAIYALGVADFGMEQAEAYHEGLVGKFALIAANPRLARRRMEFVPPVRMHPYRAHMIVYIEDDEDVLIIRVLHGRQNWAQHLRPLSAPA